MIPPPWSLLRAMEDNVSSDCCSLMTSKSLVAIRNVWLDFNRLVNASGLATGALASDPMTASMPAMLFSLLDELVVPSVDESVVRLFDNSLDEELELDSVDDSVDGLLVSDSVDESGLVGEEFASCESFAPMI